MARPREFDEKATLEKALLLFWQRGFDGVSIADVVDTTGVQRQSLYNVYTDKGGLFRAALARYLAHTEESLASLDHPRVGMAHVRRYMETVLEMQRREGVGACLLVKTAFGPGMVHADVGSAVEAGASLVRRRFARVISSAVERGDLETTVAPDATAAFLYTVLNGLSALICTGGERAHIASILVHTFESIGHRPARMKPRSKRKPTRSQP